MQESGVLDITNTLHMSMLHYSSKNNAAIKSFVQLRINTPLEPRGIGALSKSGPLE